MDAFPFAYFLQVSELTGEGTPLRWAKVGMNLHVFAWIFAICEILRISFERKVPFCFLVLATPRSLRDLADFEQAN